MNGKSAVYSCKEKLLLVQLVKENGVIEDKRTDGATLAEKKKAWECIANTFNSQPEVDNIRTAEQLRKLWNNLKQRKRKDTTALRYSMLATGGGPMETPKPDVVLDFMDEAAPHLDVGIDCPWDSTGVFEEGQTEAKKLQEETAESNKTQLPASKDASDPCLLPSTSKSKFSVSTSTIKRVATESDRRIKKIVDATLQQQELHAIRKKIAEKELLRVDIEAEKAEIQKQAAEFERQKVSDEAEIASLQLKLLKKRMLSDGR